MSTVASLGSAQVSSELSNYEANLEKPITQLDDQIATDKADISAWGSISGAVSTLQNSLAGISDISTINNLSASTSQSTVATATAALGGETGTFNVAVTSLATSQEVYFKPESSAAAALTGGAGSLTVSLGGGKSETIAVGSGSLTLSGVAAAINKAAGGVKASIVSTSTGATLVLQGSATGSSQNFSVSGTGALSIFTYPPASSAAASAAKEVSAAKNAVLTINGVPVTSATNTLGSAISGVTLSLAGTGSTVISVASSPAKLTSAVSSVASSLAAALSSIAKETKYVAASAASSSSSASAKSGPLLGNFTATNLSDQLLSAVSGAAASGLSANAIGLSVSSTGTVSFSSAAFSSTFAANPKGVTALLGEIYTSLDTITGSAIGTSTTASTSTGSANAPGAIGAQTNALQNAITSINSNIAQLTKQDDAEITNLATEYSNAEAAATSAQITQEYLSIFTGSGSASSGVA